MESLLSVRTLLGKHLRGPGESRSRARAIPGAVPRSLLESRVLEILAAHPLCAWDHLVAEIAHHLRRTEDPGVLASLDEGFWGGWAWGVLAREELLRLEGILFEFEASPLQVHAPSLPLPGGQSMPHPPSAATRDRAHPGGILADGASHVA